ncbi:sensor histidine kinase [Aquibacillus salsiterrae]|uniref:histidine kinase n=1 Tax=Aquibacillus salsiterrae TaxID=2950439 RepID=A0A9X3WDG4_9BACI|nr:HAMP domain-containing sensor histidine kinase [Aquibacillus salsiterrae]MDC3417612.1 HAMP domain-containing histidine kinase [Aquibacillus salsiterrae]
MLTFENYLFELLIILVPIFIFFTYIFKNNQSKTNLLMLGLLCALSVILTMSFSSRLPSGIIFDLRHIPWLIAFLYGSNWVGAFIAVLIVLLRATIGFDAGLLVALFVTLIASIGITFVIGKYRASSFYQRLALSALFTVVNNLLVIVGIVLVIDKSNLNQLTSSLSYFVVANLFTTLLVIYIIETLLEKERNKVQLQQSERVKLIGEMAASVAHEIKNPLTVVMGFTQILKGDKNLTARQLSSLELIDSELKRAETIIYDYLSFAKSKPVEVEKLNIMEVVNNVVEVTKYHAQLFSVVLKNETHGNYCVKANRSELTQVFLNIVKNGIEAIEKDGEITINFRILGRYIEINIIDNGKGMSEKEVSLLGIPYHSTKEHGTGLGMMVCYKIINSLKGELNVRSKQGVGTTFSIVLPLAGK